MAFAVPMEAEVETPSEADRAQDDLIERIVKNKRLSWPLARELVASYSLDLLKCFERDLSSDEILRSFDQHTFSSYPENIRYELNVFFLRFFNILLEESDRDNWWNIYNRWRTVYGESHIGQILEYVDPLLRQALILPPDGVLEAAQKQSERDETENAALKVQIAAGPLDREVFAGIRSTIQLIDPRITVGTAAFQGKRPSMQDRILTYWSSGNESPLLGKGIKKFGIVGVFDGHGPLGGELAEFAKREAVPTILSFLAQLTAEQLQSPDAIRKTLQNSFSEEENFLDAPHAGPSSGAPLRTLDSVIKQSCLTEHKGDAQSPCLASGSTATVLVILGSDQKEEAYAVQIGDSRTIEINKGGVRRLTLDHSLDEPGEIELAFIRGAEIWQWHSADAMRLNGILAMSRALGNWQSLTGVGYVERLVKSGRRPDVSRIDLTEGKIVLMSDGVFIGGLKADSNIVKVVLSESNNGPEASARRLVDQAYREGSTDNIAAAVVEIHPDYNSMNLLTDTIPPYHLHLNLH